MAKNSSPFMNKYLEKISSGSSMLVMVRIINDNFTKVWSALVGVKKHIDNRLKSIDHKNLSNIGDNTHDEIDTHIGRHVNAVFVSPTEPESPEINDIWIKI